MDVILELGSYEFRAYLIYDGNVVGTQLLPAEVYISENGSKYGDNIYDENLTAAKLKNIVTDPISISGRPFKHERVLAHVANSYATLVPNKNHQVQINLRNNDHYYPSDVVGILLRRLTKTLQNEFLGDLQNLDAILTIKIEYPIKYTTAMDIEYREAMKSAELIAEKLPIDQVLLLEDQHRGQTILLLDIGHITTRIYVLKFASDSFRYDIVQECEFKYGGSQFNIVLSNHFITKMNITPLTSLDYVRINKLCDKIKKELSTSTETTFEYKNFSTSITRQEFEKMIRRFVHAIFEKYRNISRESDIQYYFARGDSVLIPCIHEKLKKEYSNIIIITSVSKQQ